MTVMTIFYGVEQSHVRKQIGDFGISFDETCARKKPTDEQRQKWIKVSNDVGIEGEDFLRFFFFFFFFWDNEAKMIKKIAKDVLDKLNVTPSKDFDGMEGLGAHLKEMLLLLDLHEDDGVKMLTCFVENRKGSYPPGLDDYERLGDKRVLIILDDVDNIRKLEALANETTWFGSGSRIVVTTENKELLQQH
uniref:TIR domain-containing protein n=1 Tax=Brassica oleracea TaxID=3712 RepID=A0A3P6C1K0_BRAOL|nr:unnamed protein product [Brassica oleracea]